MIVIFGQRPYGRVEANGGEHIHTLFHHVYYMPLIPVSSFWVIQELDGARGLRIRLNAKSVLATYLRIWAPLIGVFAFGVTGASLVGMMVALALFVLSGWSWRWRHVRGEAALRRSDFNLLAFSLRCEPARLPTDIRRNLKTALEARWTVLGAGQPPDDVASFGASSLDEAVTGYGLLRLAAVDKHPGAREAADRILRGTHAPRAAGGPYRGGDRPVASDIAAQVTAAAGAHAAARIPHQAWWSANRKIAAACLVGAVAIAGLTKEISALYGIDHFDRAALESATESHRFVDVRCDALEWLEQFTDGEPVYACRVDDKVLAVVGKPDAVAEGTVVTGHVEDLRHLWPEGHRAGLPSLVLPVGLRLASHRLSFVTAVFCIVVLLVLAGIALSWLYRRWSRSKPNV